MLNVVVGELDNKSSDAAAVVAAAIAVAEIAGA
jgi:hypothetical protein